MRSASYLKLAGITEGISGQLTRFLDHPVLLAVLAGGLVLAGVVVLIAVRRRRAAAGRGFRLAKPLLPWIPVIANPTPSVVQDASRREETRQ